MAIHDNEREVILAYIDTAKSFVQLASGGLVIPLLLKTDVLGLFGHALTLHPLTLAIVCVSWLMFLIAIGAGVLYQYAAVKFLEYSIKPDGTFIPRVLRHLVVVRGPGAAYGLMVVAFYLGAVAVVVYSAIALMT